MSQTMIQQFAKNLVNEGVELAFGVTGSGASLQLITELQKYGVRYYPVFHEASAAIMAGAAGHEGKLKAVAITIKGPGFINLLPGLLINQYENRPMFSISEAYGENIPQFRMHKRLNHQVMCQELVSAYTQVTPESELVANMRRLAESERPAPIHFDLTNAADKPSTPIIYLTVDEDRRGFSQVDYQDCLKTLEQSQKPLIILGSLANRHYSTIDWSHLSIPIVTTAAAKGAIDETLLIAAGVITGEKSDFSPESNIISQADCILAIGLRNTEVIKADNFGIPTYIIDTQAGELQDGFEANAILPITDSKDLLPLIETVASKSWGQSLLSSYRKKLGKLFAENAQANKWSHSQVFESLQRNISYEYSLVVDTGFFCTVAETVFKAKDRLSYLGSGIGRFMGVALPSAIGLALAHPSRVIFCAVGDGGLPPYLSELKLAIKEKLPITVLFFSDGRYGSVASYADNVPEVKQCVNFDNMNWSQVVKAMGASSYIVNNSGELYRRLIEWESKTGPLFLQLDFEPEIYARCAKLLR